MHIFFVKLLHLLISSRTHGNAPLGIPVQSKERICHCLGGIFYEISLNIEQSVVWNIREEEVECVSKLVE